MKLNSSIDMIGMNEIHWNLLKHYHNPDEMNFCLKMAQNIYCGIESAQLISVCIGLSMENP